jgi:ADP-ribose pyrophosphatase
MVYKQISSKLLHNGWVSLRKDIVRLPGGRVQDFTYAEAPPGVVVLAVTNQNKVLLVEQYRVPLKRNMVELVAGRCEPSESPEQTALRELQEETGYHAKELHFLGTVYPTSGQMNFECHMFFAKNLQFVGLNPDETEFLTQREIPLDELKELILKGKLDTSMMLAYFLAKEKGLL